MLERKGVVLSDSLIVQLKNTQLSTCVLKLVSAHWHAMSVAEQVEVERPDIRQVN
jgi:hypothetical protein